MLYFTLRRQNSCSCRKNFFFQVFGIFQERFYYQPVFCTSQILKQFSTYVPLLYPMKTSENLQFSHVFKGYRSGTQVENGLSSSLVSLAHIIPICFSSNRGIIYIVSTILENFQNSATTAQAIQYQLFAICRQLFPPRN